MNIQLQPIRSGLPVTIQNVTLTTSGLHCLENAKLVNVKAVIQK